MTLRSRALGALLSLTLGSCFLLPEADYELPPPLATRAIGPGDHLTVRDQDAPAVPLFVGVVAEDGTIELPALGPFPVDGYTAEDLEAVLLSVSDAPRRRLQVEIGAADRAAYLYGELARPGHTPLRGATGVEQAVHAAGPLASADLTRVRLLRGDGWERLLDLSAGADGEGALTLADGDLVLVPPRAEPDGAGSGAYLCGEVREAGYRDLAQATTVAEAVHAGRPRERTADLTRVLVLRADGSLEELAVDGRAERELRPGDLVVVPPARGR